VNDIKMQYKYKLWVHHYKDKKLI